MMQSRRSPQRGVSLIEALVALAVMAIGMMGLVGVQSTLRSTSDVAKQRSEAVRIAQQEIERLRAFTALTGGPGTYYAPMANAAANIVGTNATFTRTTTVSALAAPQAGTTLYVDVTWTDRTDQNQRVQLSTVVAGIAPELAGTLVVPGDGDLVRRPGGRNRGIPRLAKELGGGNSGWIPPGAPAVAWVFNNLTGLISLCTTTAANTAGLIYDTVNPAGDNVICGADKAVLVSGFVRYEFGSLQPVATAASAAASAAAPSSMPIDAPALNLVQVWVQHTTVGPISPMQCNIEHFSPGPGSPNNYSAYYCAVPVTVIPGVTPNWTGSLLLRRPDAVAPLERVATLLADTDPNLLKVCRYQAAAAYAMQSDPLANQNFLLTRAGTGAVAYTCPAPPPNPLPIPLPNPQPVWTWPHQPVL